MWFRVWVEWMNVNWWMWIILGVVVVGIILAIVIPCVVHHKRKKRRAAEAAAMAATEQPAERPTEEEPIEVEPIAEPAAEEAPKEIVYRAEPIEDEAPAEEPEPAPVEPAPAPEPEPVPETAATEEPEPEPAPVAKPAAKSGAGAAAKPAPQESQPKAVVKTAKAAPAKKEPQKRVGKWTIELKADGEYVAKLSAINGEVMLTSEVYSDPNGAIKGIATIIKNVEVGTFIIYSDKNGNYYYKLKSTGNRLLCVGEIYQSRDRCENAVQSVKRIAAGATVVKDVVEGKYVDYTPIPTDKIEKPKGGTGKWKVERGENGFSAKLYASNGQLMLATEELSTKKAATDSIASVKEYALQGNFRIDRDKFNRFYWKLRNNQKSIVCIGEAYDTLDSCVKSLESVRRFASSATVEK